MLEDKLWEKLRANRLCRRRCSTEMMLPSFCCLLRLKLLTTLGKIVSCCITLCGRSSFSADAADAEVGQITILGYDSLGPSIILCACVTHCAPLFLLLLQMSAVSHSWAVS